jgi:uncharacterized protein
MNKQNKKVFVNNLKNFLAPTNLGVYILISAILWSVFFYRSKLIDSYGSVTVTGIAYQDVTSDFAEWRIDIVSENSDRSTSYNSVLESEKKVRNYLKLEGFDDSEISESSYKVVPVYKKTGDYGAESTEIDTYKSYAYLNVSSQDVYRVSDAKTKFQQFMVNQNVFVSTESVDYYFKGLESLKVDLLEDAIKNAKERAKAISKNTGSRVGKVTRASQGIFQVNAANDLSVSDYGNYNTQTINKTIRSLVDVTFSVR